MTHIWTGSCVLATDLHGFTPLEVQSLDGDDVTVLIDPRVGLRSQKATIPAKSVSHVLNGTVWEHVDHVE